MIVTNVFGGLGNQMFQYATGRALALDHGCEVRADLADMVKSRHEIHNGFELSRVFRVPLRPASERDVADVLGVRARLSVRRLLRRPQLTWLRPNRMFIEPHFQFWPHLLTAPNPCYLHGFWQSERYFRRHAKKIRDDFTFPRTVNARNARWLDHVLAVESVSLHVRRGDFVSDPRTSKFHGSVGASYYQDAVLHVTQRVRGAELFVFSDDIDWVRNNLHFDVSTHYVTGNLGPSSYVDMQVMASCKHNIIANSTFSWWGAWLNVNPEKIVVAPRRWFAHAGVDSSSILPSGFRAL